MSRSRGGLAEDVAQYVRAKILAGELRPGQKIDQDAVADACGVSRSPTREALVVLGHEGWVEVLPRRGVVVAHLSREDVIDHYELFGMIAGRVAAQAATDLTDEQLAELETIHDRFIEATGEHGQLNDDFHRIINSSASRRTRWLLRHLERSIPEGFYGATPGWAESAVKGHEQVLGALLERDPAAARQAMEEHLHEAGVAAVAALETSGFWKEEE